MREAGMRRWERSFEACWGAINETTSNILRPAATTSSWFWETETHLKLLEFQLCCGRNDLSCLPLRVTSGLSARQFPATRDIACTPFNSQSYHFLSTHVPWFENNNRISTESRILCSSFLDPIWWWCLHNVYLWAEINVILITRWQESISAQNIRIWGSRGHQRPGQNIIKHPDTDWRHITRDSGK